MRTFCYSTVLALCCLAFAGCVRDGSGDDVDTDAKEVGVGDSLPPFQVQLDDGSLLDSDMLRGKTGVVVFFHTGCTDCQQALPVLNELYLAHRADERFCLVCIAREQKAEQIQSFWQEHNLQLPYSPQEDRSLYRQFAQSRIPRIYICDTQQRVRFMHDDRSIPNLETLEQELETCQSMQQ